jgi:nuclear pore complex protein Nup93
VAALWEYQETEVEGVHLALALACHGFLRIATRAETSDMMPRKYPAASKTNYTFPFFI